MPEPAFAASCCVVGGGPAGVMLGLLLARAGVDVPPGGGRAALRLQRRAVPYTDRALAAP